MDRNERAKEISLAIVNEVFAKYPKRDFAVRLWDGTAWTQGGGSSPRFTLVLNHPGALRKMFLPPSELHLGEAYIYGDFDVEGDLIAAFPMAEYLQSLDLGLGDKLGLARQLLSLPDTTAPRKGRQAAQVSGERHSRERDRQAISYHYDISNDFYALWLDKHMVYSCAYFTDPDEDIDTAQERKLDYICRKLRLQPGERLLDIGCGWGGLVIYVAQHYGVEALGITLSQLQVDLARERIEEAGLGDRCRVAYMDYREVSPERPFDKLVSVGMFEHVGEAKMRIYFDQARDLLRPEGLFLNHAIACPGWQSPSNKRDTVGQARSWRRERPTAH
jgi:cyclopropane-fatty-acyl-phospholipid synthase